MDLTPAEMAQLAYDRSEIADTLFRYAFGLDHGDPDSLTSAFTTDCVLDFTAAGRKLRIDFSVLHGHEGLLQTLLPMIGPLDTSHTPSNLQVEVNGDSATLHAYMESQHFMPGDGPKHGSEYALLMNRYEGELVRDGAKWRISRLLIDNAWAEGDPGILTALAVHRVAKAKQRGHQ